MPTTHRRQRLTYHRRSSHAFHLLEDRRLLSVSPINPWDDRNASAINHGGALSDSGGQEVWQMSSDAMTASATAAAFNPTISVIQSVDAKKSTINKPQSKVWTHDGRWFTVFPDSSGTQVFRLDGQAWTKIFTLSSSSGFRADVKSVGNVTHILLFNGSSSKLASIQYKPASDSWEFWSKRPGLTNVSFSSNVETATIDIDSTGRMWAVSDAKTTIEARYSDAPYTSFSGPITLATGINSDDISAVTALPGNKIGVMWSNQKTKRFGFRTHQDGASPTAWSADEVPAGSAAINAGAGMADDHINLAVASDGTLYAAIKTGYEKKGLPTVGLLVRRPSGAWDQVLYQVTSKSGTRPIVVLNEAEGRIIVAYRKTDSDGPIVYKDSPTSSISFGTEKVLIDGAELNDVTSTKQNFTNEIVFIASGKPAGSSNQRVKGVVLTVSPSGVPLVRTLSRPPALASALAAGPVLGTAPEAARDPVDLNLRIRLAIDRAVNTLVERPSIPLSRVPLGSSVSQATNPAVTRVTRPSEQTTAAVFAPSGLRGRPALESIDAALSDNELFREL